MLLFLISIKSTIMKIKITFTFFAAIVLINLPVNSQTILEADGPGNTYELINSVFAPGYNVVEHPECVHPEELVRSVVPLDQVRHITSQIRSGDGEVELSLRNANERTISSSILADQIREKVAGKVPGTNVRVTAQSGLWMLRRLFGSGGAELSSWNCADMIWTWLITWREILNR